MDSSMNTRDLSTWPIHTLFIFELLDAPLSYPHTYGHALVHTVLIVSEILVKLSVATRSNQPHTCGHALVHTLKSLAWLVVAIRSNYDLNSLKYCVDTMTWNLFLINWQNGSISLGKFQIERHDGFFNRAMKFWQQKNCARKCLVLFRKSKIKEKQWH